MDCAADNRFSTYRQYKEDTEKIAGWLVYNARKCGYRIDEYIAESSTDVLTVPSKRLKGKARKRAQTKPPVLRKTPTIPKYSIKVSDFSRMARVIAEFKPKVDIPKALDNLFRRVIATRTQVTQWHERSSHGDKESNKTHAHFTSVLTNAWTILCPSTPPQTSHAKKRTKEVPESEPTVNLVNRFSALEVEELQDLREDTEPSSSDELDESNYKLTDIASVTLLKSEEDIESEFFLAIFCFMTELNEMRSSIRESWQAYRRGRQELIMASLLTNTAIQLVRRAELELDLMIERPKRYPSATYPVWRFPDILVYRVHQGLDLDFQGLDKFLEPSSQRHIFSCPHGKLCLADIFSALKHVLVTVKNPGFGDLLNEVATDTENLRRLMCMLPKFHNMARPTAASFACDEISSGIEFMFTTKTIPIYVAFGVQLLLDIQDELVSVPENPVFEVKKHMRNMLSTFKSRKLDQEPFTIDDEGFKWLMNTLAIYEKDILHDNLRRELSVSDELNGIAGLPERILEPDYFLRINPVKCGMLKYGIRMQYHRYACDLEGVWRGITCMIHLYVAGRSLYPGDPLWPDMEYFLRHQDLDLLFIGGIPQSMDEAYRKFLLAAGVKASNFARNKRSTKQKLDLTEGRRAANPCLLDSILSEWMCGGELMSDDMIFKLVRAIGERKVINEKARRVGMTEEMIEKCAKVWSGPNRTMYETLGALGFFIIAEIGDLYFDWLSFAETCQRIWTQIHDTLELPKSKRPHHITAMHILHEAQTCQLVAEEDKKDVASSVRKHATGLVQSWAIIQKICRKGMKVTFGKDEKRFKDVKAWVGDKELFNVASKALDESAYPCLTRSFLQRLYENWPEEDVEKSAVILMNEALPGFWHPSQESGHECYDDENDN
ncbi:hypothetical protein Daesc_005073 [Daldinia eschscholtzii]|uniref:DUF6604 domain-containing protein n=1 Tax=Daldinia eschscholtzii TaxID=292717 RepID=A0AAX6MJH9_9PEZI